MLNSIEGFCSSEASLPFICARYARMNGRLASLEQKPSMLVERDNLDQIREHSPYA